MPNQNHLFIIAIDDYDSVPSLDNPKKDAKKLSEILHERYDFDSEHTIELYDTAATRDAILQQLIQYKDILDETDSLIIFFAGHGSAGAGGATGFWLLSNYSETTTSGSILHADLINHLSKIECLHIYLIVDSCFSETIRHRGGPHQLGKSLSYLKRRFSSKSRRVFISGRGEVPDGIPAENSPFLEAMARVLENPSDSFLPATLLESQVRISLESQDPEGSVIPNLSKYDEGGEFCFSQKYDGAKPVSKAQEMLWELSQNYYYGIHSYLEEIASVNGALHGFTAKSEEESECQDLIARESSILNSNIDSLINWVNEHQRFIRNLIIDSGKQEVSIGNIKQLLITLNPKINLKTEGDEHFLQSNPTIISYVLEQLLSSISSFEGFDIRNAVISPLNNNAIKISFYLDGQPQPESRLRKFREGINVLSSSLYFLNGSVKLTQIDSDWCLEFTIS